MSRYGLLSLAEVVQTTGQTVGPVWHGGVESLFELGLVEHRIGGPFDGRGELVAVVTKFRKKSSVKHLLQIFRNLRTIVRMDPFLQSAEKSRKQNQAENLMSG